MARTGQGNRSISFINQLPMGKNIHPLYTTWNTIKQH